MKNGRAIIFTGGDGPGSVIINNIVRDAGLVVAADSGWDLARDNGIMPEFYIGDMDSVEDHMELERLEPERLMKYPVDKDFTDTELAIKFVEEKNYRDIVLIGGGGGRIDHLLGITSLFCREIRPAEWYTAFEHIIYTEKDCELECSEGQTVSIFSSPGGKALISTRGLKWELDGRIMDTANYSLSNLALKNRVGVKVHSGAVLIMLNY